MTIFNLGSINIDLIYRVSHFPAAGETLTARDHERMLGGKGANQSIALARAGGDVRHIGSTSAEDGWLRAEMRDAGVDISGVQDSGLATGHAVVSEVAGDSRWVGSGAASAAHAAVERVGNNNFQVGKRIGLDIALRAEDGMAGGVEAAGPVD